ncbi:GAF domain-containing sensor histidine kinase [Rhodoferax aquaticus]|uniref:histidine kinase n=1 Tax=Rhodoferax aquaticus TaxID=2527691 RepID=A0A515ETW9_9BURK|nr:ATP-binding protein [Rhodoferax aquaticus]QDL56130.1 GAF domain-containing protein [Rhodoferax aquaticus]
MSNNRVLQRLGRLEAILQLMLVLDQSQGRSSNLDDLMLKLHEGVIQLMDARNFYLAVLNESRTHYRFAYYCDTMDDLGYPQADWIPMEGNTSLTAWLLRNAKPLILEADDFHNDAPVDPTLTMVGTQPVHWMGMPLLKDSNLAVGAMVVQSYDPERLYSEEDQAVFQMLANVVAGSVSRLQTQALLERAVAQRTQALEAEIAERRRSETLQRALFEVSALSGAGGTQLAQYAQLHSIIGRLIPAPNFYVALLEPQSDSFHMAYFVDSAEPDLDPTGRHFPLGNGLTARVLRSDKAQLLSRAAVDALILTGELDTVRGNNTFVQWMGVPLVIEGATIGAIVVQSYDEQVTYGQADVELMIFVARHVSDTLATLRTHEALVNSQQELVRRNTLLSNALENLSTAQAELVRTAKMSALGSLVAGVAHELNTPLGISLLVASGIEEQTHAFSAEMQKGLTRSALNAFVLSTQESADVLMRSLRRAADLVSSFKQVAVDQTSEKRRQFSLQDTVAELLRTLGPSIRSSTHTVDSEIEPQLQLESYPGALGQVLTNLIMNTFRHAFEGRTQGAVHIHAKPYGHNKVELTVRDNGHGIPAAHLDRVFDPFFTTKLGQGGSGLGLNIVFNLVQDVLGGTIQVESLEGQGTCFTLVLPLVAPKGGAVATG